MPTKEELDPYGHGTGSNTLGFERLGAFPQAPTLGLGLGGITGASVNVDGGAVELPARLPRDPSGQGFARAPAASAAVSPAEAAFARGDPGPLPGGVGVGASDVPLSDAEKALAGAKPGQEKPMMDVVAMTTRAPTVNYVSGEGGPGGDPNKAAAVFKPGAAGGAEASGAGGEAPDPYAKANQLGSLLLGLAMRGSAPVKAGWVNTTKSNVQEGSESAETNQMMRDAVDLGGVAAGKKAEVAKAADEAQAKTYRAAADQAIRTMSEIDQAGEKQQAALDARAEKQAAEAAKLDPDAPGLEGLLNRAKIQAAANQAGSALMAINTGADVNAAMAQNAAARNRMDDKRRTALDESDKAKVGSAAAKKDAALARQEASADHLAQTLKGQSAEFAAQGRLAELEGLLASLEEKKAKIRGDREAKLMGTTTSGQKYRQASGGGPNLELLKYLHNQQVDMDKATQATDARTAAAAAKNKGMSSVIIDGRRVDVDPSLPAEAKNQIFKEAEAQQKAKTALNDISQARADLGLRRILPDWLQGQDGARLRAAVQEYARHESVAQGQSGLMDADRKAAEGLFGGAYDAQGAIDQKRGSLGRIGRDLTRRATGRD